MKKIMIAVCAVALAAMAQAATVSWSCTLVKNGTATGTPSNSGIAYLMLASDVADFTALAGKGATAVNEALGDALISYTPSTAGNYTHTSVANATLGLDDGKDYGNAYLVIFNTATVTDASSFYVTGTQSLSTYAGDNDYKLAFGSQSANSKVAGNWNAVSVPEPTSGLLFLLGLAGMALKRKIA